MSVPQGKPTAWIGFAAVAALIAGITVLYRPWPPERRPAGGALPRSADTSDAVVEQALGQIPVPVDSVALKSRWMDEVKGVDVAALDAGQRQIFLRFANAERCTCGCGYTLAACRTYDLTCPVSLPRVEKLRDSVRVGWIRSASGLRERPSAGRETRGGSGTTRVGP